MSNLAKSGSSALTKPKVVATGVGIVAGLVVIPMIPIVGAVVAFLPLSGVIAAGLGGWAGYGVGKAIEKS